MGDPINGYCIEMEKNCELVSYLSHLPQDKDGDRAVHHASFGDEPEIVDLLAQHTTDLNVR